MDRVDRIVAAWSRERPDLDPAPMAPLGRLFRTAKLASGRIERVLGQHGLQPGWFDLLASLRRAGDPYELSPGQLAEATMLSTGGMTKRLDRMEAAGLIERRSNPDDRRALRIALTARGRRTVDAAVEAHLDNERRILAPLSLSEQSQLDRLLRKLLADLEQMADPRDPAPPEC